MKLRAILRAAWDRLRGGELTPWRAAASVAVGLAIGVTPLWGAHFLLVLAVCMPLRLDVRIAYVAANVSLPFIAPFLTIGEIQLGALVRGGHAIAVDRAAIHAHGLDAFARDLAIGTAIVAPSAAALGFFVAFAVSALWPRKTPLGRAIARAAARYPTRGARIHARAKLASDPVARALSELGPLGEVADVGCGAGYMSLLLIENDQTSRVRGVDASAAKIALARRAARDLPVELALADARDAEIAPCDTVLLVDVLHYVPDKDQDALLTRAAAAARRRVIVRDIDPRRGLASFVTRLAERTRAVPHARTSSAIAQVLEREGLAVRIRRCDEGTPFANALIVGERD